jgi:hypothetical protein
MLRGPEKSIFDARWLLAVPFAIGLTVMAAGFLLT